MAMRSLPPGFRFHPTDVELVMYYLKRKIIGKKLRFEAIAEVNIYKFSPWDLPDKSCLKSKDLKWYFFCPREKKYASGGRVKRATENGYWKTTGKDRPIRCNDQTVGTVKTLVFHLGNAPQGDRTDWVIHEYRILDMQLAAAGIQDTYVLCKIFKKAGPGPMNGAQYGAPFNEEEWSEDDVADTENHPIPIASDLPPPSMLILPSGLPLTDGGPSPTAGHPVSEVLLDETDEEITLLLARFTDGDNIDENGTSQVNFNTKGKAKYLSGPDEYGIYNDLGDLDGWAQMDEGRSISGMQKDSYLLENVCDDQAFIEMNDFLTPLNYSTGAIGSDWASVSEIDGSYNHYNDIPNPHLGASSSVSQYEHQQPALPEQSYEGNIHLNMPQMVNNQFHKGLNSTFDLGITEGQPVEGDKFEGMERGTHIKIRSSRLMDSIPALTPSAAEHLFLFFYTFGGSSMHIKAEVTHGAGECTNEALLFMMEGSGSCWCNLPLAVSREGSLWFRHHLLYLDLHH